MVWIGYVKLDPDKSDVGAARAVWDEGGPDEFTYSRRAKVSGLDAAAFVAEAQAALAADAASKAQNAALAATLTTLLNA